MNAKIMRIAGLLLAAIGLCACNGEGRSFAAEMTGGNPQRGKQIVRNYGCSTCHTIPGVTGADGKVGPPLEGIATRAYLAGRLPNTRENMIRWIQTPRSIDPETIMPNMGVSENDARDITSFLYTLE